MNFVFLRAAIALACTGAAAWQDWKTSFIDERLCYAMIALGAAADLATGDMEFIKLSLGGAAVIFGAGYLLYRTGKLGGGDVLLYTGLHLLLPLNPMLFATGLGGALLSGQSFQPQLLADVSAKVPFFFSLFVMSTLLALFGSGLQYALELRKLKKLKPEWKNALLGGGTGLLALVAINYYAGLKPVQIAFYSLVFLPALFLMAFGKQLMDEVIIKRISVSKIEDEDVLALEKMPAQIVSKYQLGPVVTKGELEKLKTIVKKEGITTFPIAKTLPRLGPYILLALILGLAGLDLAAVLILIS